MSQQRRGILGLWLLWALLFGGYFALRLPRLRAMPVFVDESTYARWTQIILQDGSRRLFVSMLDAKLPLHYWLMALTRWLAGDPILAGRLLSVIVGAVGLFFVPPLCRELVRLGNQDQDELWRERVFGLLAAGFIITCPFVALQQRMILAEALLITEALALTWLSLALARQVMTARRVGWGTAMGLGIVWACTLLTKQNFSYLLWLVPPAALLVRRQRGAGVGFGRQVARWAWGYGLATLIGLAIFVPALFSDGSLSLSTRLFYKPAFYSGPLINRLAGNIVSIVAPLADHRPRWWPYDPRWPLDGGWLYAYFTPVLYVLVLVALWQTLTRNKTCRRVPAFLLLWMATQWLPLIVGGGTIFPRYLVIGALPLLLLIAWWATGVLAAIKARWPHGGGILAAAGLVAGMLAMPAWVCAWTAADAEAPTLVAADAQAFHSSMHSGKQAEALAAWLEEQARARPITVITAKAGAPADYCWLMLSQNPRISLLSYNFDQSMPPLSPLTLGKFNRDNWAGAGISRELHEPVYYVMRESFDEINEIWNAGKGDQVPPGSQVVQLFAAEPQADGKVVSRLRVWKMPGPSSTSPHQTPGL